jgi:hypothetical protein
VSDQNHWVFHVLRRKAEAMIVPILPAFLDGKYQPRDNDERLALLGADADLARLREPSALDELAVQEREEWLALWKEVGVLVRKSE